MQVWVIIETDLDGHYCSSQVEDDKDRAEEIAAMYKRGKQGFLHNYKIETHYMG